MNHKEGLSLQLKAECEAQHARAEVAERALTQLREGLQALIMEWRESADYREQHLESMAKDNNICDDDCHVALRNCATDIAALLTAADPPHETEMTNGDT